MIRRSLLVLLALCILASACGCGAKKVLHCDNCGIEVEVNVDSDMEEDWLIYCEACNEALFADDPVLGAD